MNASFYLESLGCAKNQVDSEHLIALLEGLGLTGAVDPAAADLLIVNTCGFIQSAKQESIDAVLALRAGQPGKKIVLVGCLALRHQAELERELGEVDGVWGDIFHPSFPDFILGLIAPDRCAAARLDASRAEPVPAQRQRLLSYPGSVYVKIAEGCANRCTYCAIPLIRGDLKSRSRSDILAEARSFVERGLFEINLIAQDTAAFGTDRGEAELTRLIEEVDALPGDFWIRLLYIHPDHFSDRLIETIRSATHILPYFDLPFQHGSRRILSAMNRRGNVDLYLALAERIRSALKGAVLRTTFLVGFPGETDADFTELLDFQKRLKPQWAGVFTYSREEGTPAASFKHRVPKKTALERKTALEQAQTDITSAWLDGQLGAVVDVLIEENVVGEDLALGRAWFQAPEVDGLVVVRGQGLVPGQKNRVLIDGRSGMDLQGAPAHG